MKKLSFGIDIGGINTAIGLVDQEGEIYAEGGIKTADFPRFDDYPQYIATLTAAMHQLLKQLDFKYELIGVGIGAPNASFHSGCIEQPANLWKYQANNVGLNEEARIFNIVEDLRKEFPSATHVAVTNDANAATIGEMIFGNAKGMRDFVMITLGTGLGSGFVSNGEMIYGHDGFAGEFGHVTVERGGRTCGCGRKGCLETYVSATGIKRTAFELMATTNIPSELRNIPFKEFDALDISKAAKNNDPLALEIFRYTGEVLGRALADVCTITSPEAIILFGGLAKAGELLFVPTKRYMEENMLFTFRNKVMLLPSGIQDKNTAVIGASALVWQMYNE
ncbi:MAG: ROK family protein [Rikenellaceae bacterium]